MSNPPKTVVWKRTPQGPQVLGPAEEFDRERQIVNQENVVFEDAYKKGLISQSEYEQAKAYQASRLQDDKGVPVNSKVSPQTTAYLGSEEPFVQKDIGAVILPKQGIVYNNQFYDVEVPKNMVISKVGRGEPVTETTETSEGTMTTTSTPLTLSFTMDPNYEMPAPPTEPFFNLPSAEDLAYGINPMNWGTIIGEALSKPPSGALDPTAMVERINSQRTRSLAYSKETGLPYETAKEMVVQADTQQSIAKLALVGGVVSFAVAPTVALIGAGTSLAVSQGIKGVTQGELLTAEEVAYSGGLGATFGVVGGAITGSASKAFPVLAQEGLKGSVARVALGTTIGAGSGAGLSAGETAILGGTPEQIVESAGQGALYGGIVGGSISAGVEVANFARPWIKGKFTDLKNKVQPERSMYNRVVVQANQNEAVTANAQEWGGLSWSDRVKGVFKPNEARFYKQTQSLSPTAKSPSIFQKVGDFLRPESAMYRKVTSGTTESSSLKPTSNPDTFYSGGKFVPFSNGKGGLSSVLIVKQKPAVASKTVKPFPVQVASWTQQTKAIEVKTANLKAEEVAKTVLKTKPKTTIKTKASGSSALAGTSELVGYNPMTYQGPEFPSMKRKRRREITETIPLSYPEGGLSHPEKLVETIDVSRVSGIGQGVQQGLGTLPTDLGKTSIGQDLAKTSLVDTRDLLDVGSFPLVDTGNIQDLTDSQQTVTEQTQDLTQGLLTKESGRTLQKGFFDVNLPEGFTRRSRRTRQGVGSYKRKYPILTGADVLEDFLGKKKKKSTKRRKKTSKHKRKGKAKK